MNKFKVGDKVIATGCSTGHGLEDRVGIVVDTDAHGGGNYCYVKDGNNKWSIAKNELELYRENNMFKKEDLKPFMRVKSRNGNMRVVAIDKNGDVCFVGGIWSMLSYYDDNLLHAYTREEDYDIMEIYDIPNTYDLIDNKEHGDLLWKREDKSEIRKELDRLEKRQLEDAQKIKELKEKL